MNPFKHCQGIALCLGTLSTVWAPAAYAQVMTFQAGEILEEYSESCERGKLPDLRWQKEAAAALGVETAGKLSRFIEWRIAYHSSSPEPEASLAGALSFEPNEYEVFTVEDPALTTLDLFSLPEKKEISFLGITHIRHLSAQARNEVIQAVDQRFQATPPNQLIVEALQADLGISPCRYAMHALGLPKEEVLRIGGEILYAIRLAAERNIPFRGSEPDESVKRKYFVEVREGLKFKYPAFSDKDLSLFTYFRRFVLFRAEIERKQVASQSGARMTIDESLDLFIRSQPNLVPHQARIHPAFPMNWKQDFKSWFSAWEKGPIDQFAGIDLSQTFLRPTPVPTGIRGMLTLETEVRDAHLRRSIRAAALSRGADRTLVISGQFHRRSNFKALKRWCEERHVKSD